jgi:hypothetical protein
MQSTFIGKYIIAYTHSHRNFKILRDNLTQLLRDPRLQIIIVELGKLSHLEHHDLRAKHVFLETDTYNLGWAFNIGAKYATNSNLFFTENKYHPRMEVIHNVLVNKGDRHCIYLQDHIGEMTMEQTDNRKQNMDIKTIPTSRGIIYYTKEGLIDSCGFDENVVGEEFWSMLEKRNSLINTGKVNGNSTIQFYTDELIMNNEIIEYSKKHWERISTIEKEQLIAYVRGQFKKIGNPHKYKKVDIMVPYDV